MYRGQVFIGNGVLTVVGERLKAVWGVQIIALGATYFIAVSALDMISNVGTIDDLTSAARIILLLPVAVLDAIFILWVFTSLSRTLNQLQARRAGAKLDLYRFFFFPCLRLAATCYHPSFESTPSHVKNQGKQGCCCLH